MKKHSFVIPTLVLILAATIVECPSSSTLSQGDSFIYNIISGEFYFQLDNETYAETGFYISGDFQEIGTAVNVSLNEPLDFCNTFHYTVGNRTSVKYLCINWLDDFALETSYAVLIKAFEFVEDIITAPLLLFTTFKIIPYVDPVWNDYLMTPELLANDIQNEFPTSQTDYVDITSDYNYTITNDLVCFESWIGGCVDHPSYGYSIVGKNYDTDIKFGNNMKFAISKDSGIVHGFCIRGWVKGYINGKKIKVSLSQSYELEDYNLPDCQLGKYISFTKRMNNLFIKIFSPITAVIGISLIIPFIIVIKKIKSDL